MVQVLRLGVDYLPTGLYDCDKFTNNLAVKCNVSGVIMVLPVYYIVGTNMYCVRFPDHGTGDLFLLANYNPFDRYYIWSPDNIFYTSTDGRGVYRYNTTQLEFSVADTNSMTLFSFNDSGNALIDLSEKVSSIIDSLYVGNEKMFDLFYHRTPVQTYTNLDSKQMNSEEYLKSIGLMRNQTDSGFFQSVLTFDLVKPLANSISQTQHNPNYDYTLMYSNFIIPARDGLYTKKVDGKECRVDYVEYSHTFAGKIYFKTVKELNSLSLAQIGISRFSLDTTPITMPVSAIDTLYTSLLDELDKSIQKVQPQLNQLNTMIPMVNEADPNLLDVKYQIRTAKDDLDKVEAELYTSCLNNTVTDSQKQSLSQKRSIVDGLIAQFYAKQTSIYQGYTPGNVQVESQSTLVIIKDMRNVMRAINDILRVPSNDIVTRANSYTEALKSNYAKLQSIADKANNIVELYADDSRKIQDKTSSLSLAMLEMHDALLTWNSALDAINSGSRVMWLNITYVVLFILGIALIIGIVMLWKGI